MQRPLDVVAIGHAIVDVLAPASDAQVEASGLGKGTMTLIDAEAAERLYAVLGSATEASGGSAANTAAGLASFGAQAAFVGRVRDDDLGKIFAHDIRAAGVSYELAPATEGPATGRCLIMVTPDAERTMSTYLGAGDFLAPEDIPDRQLAEAKVVYLEGYLCGLPESEASLAKAVAVTEQTGGRLALSLSDPFWVELHGSELRSMLDHTQILLGNADEARGIEGTDDLNKALSALADRCPLVCITMGADGAVVVSDGERLEIKAEPVHQVVDTTGAGDLFAAGFLYGVTHDLGAESSARLGALAAAEILGHFGARPLVSLRQLAQEAGLLAP